MIAFLLQDTGTVYGAERATMDLARGLASRGMDVVILLIREARLGDRESLLEAGLRIDGLNVEIITTNRRFSLALVRAIRDILKRRGVGVLHSIGYKADVHATFAAVGRIPHVSTVHGWLFRSDLKELFYGWLNVRALKHCSSVVVLSRFYEALLWKRGIKTIRIPSGLDASVFSGVVPRHGTFTVGMMGRFSEEKNHAMLLRATKRLVESGVTVDVLLAGDGPLRGAVEAEIARIDLRHVVKVNGYVPREDFLGSIDALVMCSRIENLPYSVMEAMACGLPVIATNVGGLPDLVENGVTGFLVPSDDDAALAERIKTLASKRALGQGLGAAGRGKVVRDFSVDACVSQHVTLYESVMPG